MKDALRGLSEQYRTALRKHLKHSPEASSQPALRLGRQAVALGLETLELARIHAQALATLAAQGRSTTPSDRTMKRARAFFTKAIAPIEKTHRAAMKADLHLSQLNQTLRRRAVESSASARHLQRGIFQRQLAETALRKSGHQRTRLFEQSRRLQQRSRHLTHQILSAQEDEWQRISRRLHDDIAQILVGIHVRLLTVKKAAQTNTGSLKREIASTQRLVKQSVRTLHRFARDFGLEHET